MKKSEIKIVKSNISNVKAGNVLLSCSLQHIRLFIGDDVFIGPFVEIQKNVSIGKKKN